MDYSRQYLLCRVLIHAPRLRLVHGCWSQTNPRLRTDKMVLLISPSPVPSEGERAFSSHVSAPDFLPDCHTRRAESVPSKMTNGSAHVGTVHDPVPARPVTPERPTTPISRANVPSPRSLRKSSTVKVVVGKGSTTFQHRLMPRILRTNMQMRRTQFVHRHQPKLLALLVPNTRIIFVLSMQWEEKLRKKPSL
ncbi:hypothetical protein EDB19DRAFT_980495 [Suillus lakei]|nr:hypothetical protein EDB19DRAFT_980495 [Suillus lakei]